MHVSKSRWHTRDRRKHNYFLVSLFQFLPKICSERKCLLSISPPCPTLCHILCSHSFYVESQANIAHPHKHTAPPAHHRGTCCIKRLPHCSRRVSSAFHQREQCCSTTHRHLRRNSTTDRVFPLLAAVLFMGFIFCSYLLSNDKGWLLIFAFPRFYVSPCPVNNRTGAPAGRPWDGW